MTQALEPKHCASNALTQQQAWEAAVGIALLYAPDAELRGKSFFTLLPDLLSDPSSRKPDDDICCQQRGCRHEMFREREADSAKGKGPDERGEGPFQSLACAS